MRRVTAIAALLVPVALVAGCGATRQGEIPGQAEYVRAGDEICRNAERRLAQESPIVGETLPDAVKELEANEPILVERAGALDALEPPLELRERHRELLALLGDYNATNAAALKAAREGDQAAFDSALAGDPLGNAGQIAKALGFRFCVAGPVPAKIHPQLSGSKPPAGVSKPKGTVEDAAAAYLRALGTGDCDAIAKAMYAHKEPLGKEACATEQGNLGGVLSGTEQFGPAGVATYWFADSGTVVTDAYVAGRDGRFGKVAGVVGYYPLMGPEPAGADAQRVLADAAAEMGGTSTPLGSDAAFAFALVRADGDERVLVAQRDPGTPPSYSYSGSRPGPG